MAKSLVPTLMRRLAADRTGNAAVEFAYITPVLLGLSLPLVDLGSAAYYQMRVQDAAQAGAQAALTTGYSSTTITTAAQSATSLGANVSVTPSETYNCVVSGAIGPSVASGTTCADGSTAGTYATVDTTYSYTLILAVPGLANPMTLNGSATVRID
ncbi:MAG TPA: TadE/TadG family type IV pilus assembly protein [Stellaceae bacterium]|nr:TadE/TadG family type IV pilus assembly protein [Stellaceae bacterium]